MYCIFLAGYLTYRLMSALEQIYMILKWKMLVSKKIYPKANHPLNIDNILYELSIFRDVTKRANSASAVTASLVVVSPSSLNSRSLPHSHATCNTGWYGQVGVVVSAWISLCLRWATAGTRPYRQSAQVGC